MWLCIGAGMLTLLLAAISTKKKGQCSDLVITLKGPENIFFISGNEVEALLKKAASGPIRGQAIASLHLNELEEMLEKNDWISKAELYFDSRDVLHVMVTEKEPVARVFTTGGNTFYIDATGQQMPLSVLRSAKVPVFTGFPDKRVLTGADSILLAAVRTTAVHILSDPFWMAQVAQINITPEGNMELIPVVGSHIVRLGNGENIEAKFNRLMIFYRQVVSKTGFDHYKLIDVQYKGQVVASRYAGDPKVDSVQLRKNIEKLLKYAEDAALDTVLKVLPPAEKLDRDSASVKKEDLPVEKTNNPEKNSDPNPRLEDIKPALRPPADGGQAVKTKEKETIKSKTSKPKPTTVKEEKRVPKAVMPKKVEEAEDRGYN